MLAHISRKHLAASRIIVVTDVRAPSLVRAAELFRAYPIPPQAESNSLALGHERALNRLLD